MASFVAIAKRSVSDVYGSPGYTSNFIGSNSFEKVSLYPAAN